ncbi:MAG: carbon-nitrogen hydrolase family protein [Campylobacterota bacterium]
MSQTTAKVASTSMTFKLSALQLETKNDFEKNLQKFKECVNRVKSDFIVVPEVYFTDFAYEKMDSSVSFGQKVIDTILQLSQDKTVCFTINVKQDGCYYNKAYLIHDKKIVHTQEKYKLFTIGKEIQHYTPGKKEDIKVVHIGKVKVAILICFELRFKQLWQQIEGADIVMIPAKWGKLRKTHLEILSQALAVMNQCFVIVADSSDSDMAKSSAVITPFGEVTKDDRASILSKECDLEQVKKMRRYLKVYE